MASGPNPQDEDNFITQTVKRSLPNMGRPRLATEAEARLAEVEQKSALAYAAIESVSARARRLAAVIDGETPAVENWDDEPSVVESAEDLRLKTIG